MIDKLDVRRAQVYVEALIVEVTSDQGGRVRHPVAGAPGHLEAGASPASAAPTSALTGQQHPDIAQNPASSGTGLNIGIAGQITIPGVGPSPTSAFLARALERRPTARTSCRRRTLLTLDNEEARIVVGQNVPFVTGQYAHDRRSATTATPFQTIERRDVGLTLRVRPQITEAGTVSSRSTRRCRASRNRSAPAGIITNKRSLESTVLVDDGQIVVLGGLMQDGTDRDAKGARARRHPDPRASVPLRHAQQQRRPT